MTILDGCSLLIMGLSGFLIGRLVLWGDVARVTRRLDAREDALAEREAALLVLERRESSTARDEIPTACASLDCQ